MPSPALFDINFTRSLNETTGVFTYTDATSYAGGTDNHNMADFHYILAEFTGSTGVIQRQASHDFLDGEPYDTIDAQTTNAPTALTLSFDYDGVGMYSLSVWTVPKIVSAGTGSENTYDLDDCFAVSETKIYKVVAVAGVDITVDTDFDDTTKYELLDSIKDVTDIYKHIDEQVEILQDDSYDTCKSISYNALVNSVDCWCKDYPTHFIAGFHLMMADYAVNNFSLVSGDTELLYVSNTINKFCESCGCGTEQVYEYNSSACVTSISDLTYITDFIHYQVDTTDTVNYISAYQLNFEQLATLTPDDIILTVAGAQLFHIDADPTNNTISTITAGGTIVLTAPLFQNGRQVTIIYKKPIA